MSYVTDDTLHELDDTTPPDEVQKKLTDNEIEASYKNLSFRVIYQLSTFFLPQLQEIIKKNDILELRPEYQRRLRWTTKQKSLLIESLLLNIPIPPIFLFESDAARYEVMDGQQRLNAIHDFLENAFTLTGLKNLSFLNGRRYNKLPPLLKRGLDRASINAIVLLQETRSDVSDPYVVRRHVFERLNTGGTSLNSQEMRNSIYRGPFNEMVVRLGRNNTFCSIFEIPLYTETDEEEYYENPDRQRNQLYRTMSDCQIVLRFFALQEDAYIKGSMQSILDGCMKRNQNADADQLTQMGNDFTSVIEACGKIFGNKAFLLPPDALGRRRVSIALYDALTVSLFRRKNSLDSLVERRDAIVTSIDDLLERNLDLVTGKANTSQSIKNRIAEVSSILSNLA